MQARKHGQRLRQLSTVRVIPPLLLEQGRPRPNLELAASAIRYTFEDVAVDMRRT